MPPSNENLLNSRYETLAEWARGAQGRVFLAHDRETGRPVALKVWDITSEDDRRAYETEASLIERIGLHPHLPVFVDRLVEGHRGVLVTDWVDGVTLERTLADDGSPGLPPSLVVTYLEQVARALDHLHSADPPLVHGDVKPENMILTAGGSVVLVDFGCADPLDMQGTPGFVAPELASGQPKSAASDVYAVAATAVTLITGTVPGDVPVPDTVDATTARALISGLRTALTPDPNTRTVTAGEVIGNLRAALGAERLLGPTVGGGEGLARSRSMGGSGPPASIPLPTLLDDRAQTAYVGHRDVLDELDLLRGVARDQGCRVALLTGEPGAGKTRTASELARSALARGSVVLHGQCGSEGEMPYQPFAEALRWQVAHDGGRTLGPLAGELVRIVPELGEYVPELPAPLATDPRLEGHRTFDAAAEWLIGTSQPGGLVFVIDDLHWASKATLALFQHVLKRATVSGSDAPILFLGTYRDTELDHGSPLLEVLPSLGRSADIREISMKGLAEDDISELLTTMTGHGLDDVARQVATSLSADSGGNPFFAIEILRDLLETGVLGFENGAWRLEGVIRPTPDVQVALERRFERVPQSARASLSAASVIGMEFDLELLSTLGGLGREHALESLDAVLGVGLLDETEPEKFRFEHALVRSTIYESLEPTERRRVHKEVLGALESLGRRNVATLATHALETAPAGSDLVAALGYALGAGEEAFHARAFGDAESWALRVMEIAGSKRALRAWKLRAMCLAGEAERDQGDPAFRETLLRAGGEALEAELNEVAIRSAIGNYRGTVSIVGKVDEPRVELMQKAMALEADPNSRQWALLAATLASDLTYDPDTPHAVRLDLAARARAIARSSGDDSVLLEVLLRTMAAVSVPENLGDLADTGRELVALADATGDPSMRVLARWATTTTHLAAGEFDLTRQYLAEAEAASRQNCPPRVRWLAGVTRPQFLAAGGDLSAARVANDETLALGEQAAEPDAFMLWSAVTFGLSLLEGTVGDIADLAGSTADEFPEFAVWRIAHALALGAAGRITEGRNVLDQYDLRDVERIPIDVLTLGCWSLMALAAFHLADVELAQALEPVLCAHSGAWSHCSVWILGPTDWDLGRCYLVQRNWERAVAVLDGSVHRCEVQGLRAHAAVCRLDLVRALIGRHGPGDRDRAALELERGLAEANRFGLTRRAEEYRVLGG